ncbi:MAG: hypothetical protein WC479_08970 [Candidatus Izemoplasmatales bacterium]|jgi:hypothetical protein
MMARNDQAKAALAKCEAAILTELDNLATVDAALALKEADWLNIPIVDRTVAGLDGSETWGYSSYLNYWTGRRNSVMQTIDRLENLAENLNKRIQAQQPPFRTQLCKVKF